MSDILAARRDAARDAGDWLQERPKGLRAQVTEAEEAVVALRRNSAIADTGGKQIIAQEVAEISSQLTAARSRLSEVEDIRDRTFRSRGDIELRLKSDFIGMVPTLPVGDEPFDLRRDLLSKRQRRAVGRPASASVACPSNLPPMFPMLDVSMTDRLIESYVIVVQGGASKIDTVSHALARCQGVHNRMLGLVLNKVDMNRLGLYDQSTAEYYDAARYSNYLLRDATDHALQNSAPARG